MCQEVYELLEKGNNKKASLYYLKEGKKHYYEGKMDDKLSQKCISKAIRLDPTNLEALVELGLIQRYIGRFDYFA